jgi:hypothetical protein
MRSVEVDWCKQFGERYREEAGGWHACTSLTLSEAEQLLDWLEAHGVRERETSLRADGAIVRWRG